MTITLLALALLAVLAFDGIGTFFAVLGLPTSMQYADWGFPGFNAVAGLTGALLGWPIVRAQARNPIGWLLVGLGLLSAIQFAAHYYGVYGLVISPGAVPLPGLGIWLEGWMWVPTVGSVAIIMPLVFPTGRPPSPRWRPIIWLQLAAIAIPTIGYLLQPEMAASGMRADNPLIPSSLSGLAGFLVAVGMPLFVISMVIASVSLIRRFRRSSGVERQQIKWLALAAAMVATVFAAYLVVLLETGEEANILAPFAAVSFGGILLAVTVAILRHRLLDIDLLINRALVYAGVTVVLAIVYVGAVLILQGLLATFTEQRGLVVAGSTLLVAALFAPVRRRIQRAVDRRFYRSRYDAGRVMQAFAASVRDEVDLARLTGELVSLVDHSMQPTRARVWLRHASGSVATDE